MSKGTKIRSLRLEDEIWDQVVIACQERNERTPDEIWTLSQWVRIAIVEKLDKVKRGRRKKGGVIHPPQRRVN